jgi:toxin ParE1/3/4
LYRVILTPGGRADLKELRAYIAQQNSRRVASNYLRRLKKFYEKLALAPYRGEQRFEHRPGFRVIGFEHRITILFSVSEEERQVEILGFHYGGRNV